MGRLIPTGQAMISRNWLLQNMMDCCCFPAQALAFRVLRALMQHALTIMDAVFSPHFGAQPLWADRLIIETTSFSVSVVPGNAFSMAKEERRQINAGTNILGLFRFRKRTIRHILMEWAIVTTFATESMPCSANWAPVTFSPFFFFFVWLATMKERNSFLCILVSLRSDMPNLVSVGYTRAQYVHRCWPKIFDPHYAQVKGSRLYHKGFSASLLPTRQLTCGKCCSKGAASGPTTGIPAVFSPHSAPLNPCTVEVNPRFATFNNHTVESRNLIHFRCLWVYWWKYTVKYTVWSYNVKKSLRGKSDYLQCPTRHPSSLLD